MLCDQRLNLVEGLPRETFFIDKAFPSCYTCEVEIELIMKSLFIILGLMPLTATASLAQYYAPQYHSPTIVAPPNQAPVIVPPTVITTASPESSKKSCRENVIDLFLISWRTTTGDCNP